MPVHARYAVLDTDDTGSPVIIARRIKNSKRWRVTRLDTGAVGDVRECVIVASCPLAWSAQ